MWVFSQDGFVSVVDNKVKPGYLAVRARDRQSLIVIAEMTNSEIEFTPMRDYQYRVYATPEQVKEFMTAQIEMIDYGNFKDRLTDSRGWEFHHAASQVWSVMNEIADDEYRQWADARYKKYSATR